MNNAYQEAPANPHVHRHIFPRHKKSVDFAGITFKDSSFGHHYDPDAKHEVSNEVVDQIAAKLKENL